MSSTEGEDPGEVFKRWLSVCAVGGDRSDDTLPELRGEASSHFKALSEASASLSLTATVQQDVLAASFTTANGSLASLLKTLGPVFSSSDNTSKIRALHYIAGAIEGSTKLTHGIRMAMAQFVVEICKPEEGGGKIREDFVDGGEGLSPKELTAKLEAMERQQIEDSSNDETTPFDDVRDAAMVTLEALLESNLDVFPTQLSSHSSGKPRNEALAVIYESIQLRADVAVRCINSRCASPSKDKDDTWSSNGGDGYHPEHYNPNIEDGLSQLPRVKRSLCFELLEGALRGIHDDILKWKKLTLQKNQLTNDDYFESIPDNALNSLISYASTSASCLYGETDPRCLLQLLLHLNRVQQVMLPFFGTSDSRAETTLFPSVVIFDSVAPYYPIRFTPPKNDPHGITREKLQAALLAVLCEKNAVYEPNASMLDGETMVSLSARMFMERLEPSEDMDYEPPSDGAQSEADDKIDAVNDLTSLLIPIDETNFSNLGLVDSSLLRDLSFTLARVHEKSAHSTLNDLARRTRNLGSAISSCLDQRSTRSTCILDRAPRFEAFVSDLIRHLSPVLGTAPQGTHGRASTAYMSTLAAEGGLTTLNCVLQACYPRLLGVSALAKTASQSSRDNEKVAAALRGIAALMSSCRVALKKWEDRNGGAKVHPHPLESFSADTIRIISFVAIQKSSTSLKIAANGALESFVTAVDTNALESDDLDLLSETLSATFDNVLGDNKLVENDLRTASARAISGVIAIGFDEDKDNKSVGVLASSFLPKVIQSATRPSKRRPRFDWIILSGACANGPKSVSRRIVSQLLTLAVEDTSGVTVFKLLSYLVRHSPGPTLGEMVHCRSLSDPSLFDVIRMLSSDRCSQETEPLSRQLSVGPSALRLPKSPAPQVEDTDRNKRIRELLPYLTRLFECPAAQLSCSLLVNQVDQVIPPLSASDNLELRVVLPLLSTVLNAPNMNWTILDETTTRALDSMTSFFTQFSLSHEHDVDVKSAAASCLFSILVNSKLEEDRPLALFRDEISGILAAAFNDNSTSSSSLSDDSMMENALNMTALLASAAACRGGASSRTADRATLFLAELACTGKSICPFSEVPILLRQLDGPSQRRPLQTSSSTAYVLSASAYSEVISVQNGTPFWRQRISHKTLALLKPVLQEQARTQTPPPLGTLALVCHMICCLPLSLIGSSNMEQLIPTAIAGLVYFSKHTVDATEEEECVSSILYQTLMVILGCLLKVLSTAPQFLTRFIGVIIPSLLLLSSPGHTSELYIPAQVLALQCLELISSHPNAQNAVMREKDQVTAMLSGVADHPSSIIRNAVVQTRNVWYTI